MLFGKPLQTLVTKALLDLNKINKDQVLISDISAQIFSDRPDLSSYVITQTDKRNLHKRIWNCLKQLEKANLIKTEKRSTKIVGMVYYIVYTNII